MYGLPKVYYGNDPFEPTARDFKEARKEQFYGKFCDNYRKEYTLVNMGTFNAWTFLSVLAVVGGVIIIISR